MTLSLDPAPIIVLDPDGGEARQIAEWLRGAGLGSISIARTSDEAIFMLGRASPSLLIIDEHVPDRAEWRLLRHIQDCGHSRGPVLVRLIDDGSPNRLALGRQQASEIIRKPVTAHDVVVRVGTALQRPDLIGHLDRERDPSSENLEAARRMQIGLLPTAGQLAALRGECGVGVAALYRSGEAVGGDFWGIWPTGRGRFSLAIVDFAGHGLGAALNTFRLHALLSEHTLPRGRPARMTRLLNERLHSLLPRGQYATMIYTHFDPRTARVAWCSAGGPAPLFVSADGAIDLPASGLPLGVRAGVTYRSQWRRLPAPGILSLFSDGLFESGGDNPDVPREAMAEALAEPARLAARGELAAAAQEGAERLERLRDSYGCAGHSDDIMAICVAFGPSVG